MRIRTTFVQAIGTTLAILLHAAESPATPIGYTFDTPGSSSPGTRMLDMQIVEGDGRSSAGVAGKNDVMQEFFPDALTLATHRKGREVAASNPAGTGKMQRADLA